MRFKPSVMGAMLLTLWACGTANGPNLNASDNADDAVTAAKKKTHSVTVAPTKVTLAENASQQFKATIVGGGTAVWTAKLGSIDSSGLYTAPSKAESDTVTVTVSGQSVDATAAVKITSGTGSSSGSGSTSGSGSGGTCIGTGAALEAACVGASGWGNAMSTAFGRIDGTITAIAKPTDTQCNQSNSSHFVLELVANGENYPLVVNVDDTASTGPDVYFAETNAALTGVAWSEGWHTDSAEKLDYEKSLGVTSTAFKAYSETDLVNAIVCELEAGDQVSVYALGWGTNGGHDIHRNTGGGGADGAIVLHATSNPHYLMFRFSDQSF